MTPALTLLGGLELRLGAGRSIPLPPRKVQALLAYLAVRPGVAQPREKLAALLWGDAPAERARHSLRQALLLARQALPPGLLREEGGTRSR